MKPWGLFLDDVRFPREVTWVILPKDIEWITARNFQEFRNLLNDFGLPSHVSFDHDLCTDHYIGANTTEPTGLDCAYYLVEYCIANGKKLPKYTVHSMYPKGRDDIHLVMIRGIDKVDKILREREEKCLN